MSARARDLAEQAEREFDEARRAHLFDMADAFERAADQLSPTSPGQPPKADARAAACSNPDRIECS